MRHYNITILLYQNVLTMQSGEKKLRDTSKVREARDDNNEPAFSFVRRKRKSRRTADYTANSKNFPKGNSPTRSSRFPSTEAGTPQSLTAAATEVGSVCSRGTPQNRPEFRSRSTAFAKLAPTPNGLGRTRMADSRTTVTDSQRGVGDG